MQLMDNAPSFTFSFDTDARTAKDLKNLAIREPITFEAYLLDAQGRKWYTVKEIDGKKALCPFTITMP
jgi:hypothetical protein